MSAVTVSDSGAAVRSARGRATSVRTFRPNQNGRMRPRKGAAAERVPLNGPARIIDLGAERRRRTVETTPDSAALESAIARHPAGRKLPSYAPSPHMGPLQPRVARTEANDLDREGAAAPLPQPTVELGFHTISIAPQTVARVFSFVVAALLVIGGALGLGLSLRPAGYDGMTWEHTVASGESLWGLAAALNSDRPLEEVVEDIRSLNSLQDATLQAGQVLTLPAQ